MDDKKQFPEGMTPLGKERFTFECHSGVACFTKCCKKVEIVLYPFDVLRLKNALKIDSEQFMRDHSQLIRGDNPFFPTVMLKLQDTDEKECPFLTSEGCSVYSERPSACRTYPVERAVDRSADKGRPEEYYFLTNHDYCLGHNEDKEFTIKQWVRNQRVDEYNMMNDLWAEIDTIFRTNPWKGEGDGNPKQQLCFMVCYDIDGFRKYAADQNLIQNFKLNKDQRRRLIQEDSELLKFGFEYIKLVLTGKSSLMVK